MKVMKRALLIVLIVIVAGFYSYGVWPRAIYDSNVGSSSFEVTESLTGEETFEQKFICGDNGLCGLSIKLSKQENAAVGTYGWTMEEEESGELIGEGVIDESYTENKRFNRTNPQKRGIVKLVFPMQKDSKGRTYVLKLQAQDVPEDEGVMVYITGKGKTESNLSVSGEVLVDKSSVIKLQYQRFNVETFIVFWGIAAYLAVFLKFMYKLFK